MKLLGERLGRDGLRAAGVELVETPQVDRQAIGGEFGDLFGCLPTLVRTIHKVLMLPSRAMAHMTAPSQKPRETGAFQPYVPATQVVPEFTGKAIVLGVLFGLIFGASTAYLGLRAGLTVSASIPIAVLPFRCSRNWAAPRSSRTTSSRRLDPPVAGRGRRVHDPGDDLPPAARTRVFHLHADHRPRHRRRHPRRPDDPAAPRVDREGTRCAAVPGGHRLRRRAGRWRTRRFAGQDGLHGAGGRRAWKGLSWIVQIFRTTIGYLRAQQLLPERDAER